MVMPDTTPPLAGLIKMWRERLGLTQKQLAKAAGCSMSMVQQVERGDRHFSHRLAPNVARALKLSAEESALLMSYSEVSPAETVQEKIEGLAALLTTLLSRNEGLERRIDDLTSELAELRQRLEPPAGSSE